MQLLLLATAASAAVTVATAAVPPPCDIEHKSGDEVCASFCNYECGLYNKSAGDSGQPVNVTVYRLTPKNVTGLLNKNTGSADGDVSFVLSKKNLTQYCLHNPTGVGCHTDNPNADIYGTFVVEVDGQWGPYQMCNPADGWDTADWKCGLQCIRASHADGCPRNKSQFGPTTNGTSVFGYDCWCDRTYKTAGRENPPGSGRQFFNIPTEWPPQCSTGAYLPTEKVGKCVTGTAYKVLQGWSTASVLTMACKGCDADTHCSGWRLGEDGKSVELFMGNVSFEPCPSGTSPSHSAQKHGGGAWGGGIGIGDIGGYWYSMTDEGQCKDGASLGTDGCTWRVVETKAYKNATCVDTYADMAVESYGKVCFDTCPQPLNRVTDCYLDCYRNTIMGDASLNLTAPASKVFVDPWVHALHEDDPEKDGCPPVKPTNGPLIATPKSEVIVI